MSSAFSLIFYIFFVSINLSLVHSHPSKSDTIKDGKENLLNLRYKPITINIDTNATKRIFPPSPLHLTGTITAETILVNTGQSSIDKSGLNTAGKLDAKNYLFGFPVQSIIEVRNNGNISGSDIAGIFIFSNFNYYWVGGDLNGVTGTRINGKGFPYEVRVWWKNKKYHTIEEAIQHQDGIVELVLLFRICSLPYPKTISSFDPISDKIKSLKLAGSYTFTLLATQIEAANHIPLDSIYYSYLGSFLDTYTNKKYKCSRVTVIKPNFMYCLTRNQFYETFSPLKDFFGKPLINILPQDSSHGGQVLEGMGVTQSFEF